MAGSDGIERSRKCHILTNTSAKQSSMHWERGGDLKKHRPEHIIMECCIVQKHRGRAITKQFTQRPVIRWDMLDAFAKLWIVVSTN